MIGYFDKSPSYRDRRRANAALFIAVAVVSFAWGWLLGAAR